MDTKSLDSLYLHQLIYCPCQIFQLCKNKFASSFSIVVSYFFRFNHLMLLLHFCFQKIFLKLFFLDFHAKLNLYIYFSNNDSIMRFYLCILLWIRKYDKVLFQQLLKKFTEKDLYLQKMHEDCNNYFRITFQKKTFQQLFFNIWWWNNFYVMFGYGFHVEYRFYSKLLQQKYHLYRYNEICKWFFNLIKYMVNDKIYVEMIF
jgi:hypothetical protein